MERHPPILEKLSTQISTLLEKYTLLQEELMRTQEERNILAQALEEKNSENKALYNEISLKERELENLLGKIQVVLDPNSVGGGSTTADF